ncbi:MAG: hypothetical protein ACREA0_13890 [bacterium]
MSKQSKRKKFVLFRHPQTDGIVVARYNRLRTYSKGTFLGAIPLVEIGLDGQVWPAASQEFGFRVTAIVDVPVKDLFPWDGADDSESFIEATMVAMDQAHQLRQTGD